MNSTNGMFWTVSLACEDEEFLHKWRPHLKWEQLPKGPVQFILAAALLHWDKYGCVLDYPAFLSHLALIEDPAFRESTRQDFDALVSACEVTDANRQMAWELAENWIQRYHIGMALDAARQALNADDTERVFTTLLGLHEVTGKEEVPPVVFEGGELGALLKARPRRKDARPTGVRELDNWWEGGLYPGNLGIVLAPTNVGKSMTLCYFAASAYKANRSVLFFTYELTRLQVAERILAALLETPLPELRPDTIDAELLEKRREWGVDRASMVIDDGIESVADLRHRLEEEPVDLVILDSADDMKPRQQYQNLYGAQGEVYSDILLTVCQGLGQPVWTSTQTNREAMERARYNLKFMGDSFKKAQRAHIVVGLSQTQQEAEELGYPVVKMHVLKDTLHGSRSKWARFSTLFGRGAQGYPGFLIKDIRGDF